jgi:hypothetical protein
MIKTRGVKSDATFLGWQDSLSGKSFALFNITAANHPLMGSTVTVKCLRKLNLQVPKTPILEENSFRSEIV